MKRILIGLAALSLVVGCSQHADDMGKFKNVNYDGHTFIMNTFGGNLVHHPDCLCQEDWTKVVERQEKP